MTRICIIVLFAFMALPASAAGEEYMEVRAESQKKVLEKSSRDVLVIDTKEIRAQAADTGEVLARTQGISVRRTGGLGSEERFSLNGLSDDRVRFFIDGVPLSLVGYDFGLANVPLNFMKRIEVYRGVVPIQFGADALGGAINLVTDNSLKGNRWSNSLLLGSFQTIRWTWSGQVRNSDGWLVRGSGFNDYAANNYKVEVRVPDAQGRPEDHEVERFHDRYRAHGFGFELGTTGKPWAEEFIIRAFHSENQKELQNNAVMSSAYGEAVRGGQANAFSLRYVQALTDSLRLDTISGYARNVTEFRDLGVCIYDWFGHCVNTRQIPGELGRGPQDTQEIIHSYYTRIHTDWSLDDVQHLRASLALTQGHRVGENRAKQDASTFDSLTLKREYGTHVLGLEHEWKLWDERIENTAFVKLYKQDLRTEESPFASESFQNEKSRQKTGLGDSVGLDLGAGFFLKASYEQAIRLPDSEELFGNGAQVLSNMELVPESSHNLNLGLQYHKMKTEAGDFELGFGLFQRNTRDLILRIGSSDQAFIYENLYDSTSQGIETSFSWHSPAAMFHGVLNSTYMDNRNTSKEGPFAAFHGDRIPNQPYFFVNSGLSVRGAGILSGSMEAGLHSRYTASYSRVWESLGDEDDNTQIPEAIHHSLYIGYQRGMESLRYSLNFEIQNLTDVEIFDVYGLPRPGRAYFVKSTLDL